MAESTEQLTAAKEEIKDQTSSGVDSLKGNFAQLRDEVAKLIGNALDAGKEGAGKFKDSSSESMDQLGQKIGERPLMSAISPKKSPAPNLMRRFPTATSTWPSTIK